MSNVAKKPILKGLGQPLSRTVHRGHLVARALEQPDDLAELSK